MVSILATGPSCPGFDSQHYQKQWRKLLMLLRLIHGAALRKVDNGLEILIQPI